MSLESPASGKSARKHLLPELKSEDNQNLKKTNSVVETTDAKAKSRHYSISEELARLAAFFKRPELTEQNKRRNLENPQSTVSEGTSPMSELRSPYVSAAQPRYARNHATMMQSALTGRKSVGRFKAYGRLSLLQKILISNLIIILGGAVIGSWLTAQLAEAGKFNLVSFSIIIFTAVLFSGAVSFTILKAAFKPFDELQKVLSKIHTGNPRARAALHKISDPDVRQFTIALNQMLLRLEENAHVIQEDQRQLQLMTAQVINAQENERKRIARELHDEASQSLTAMIMGLEAARKSAPAENVSLCNQLGSLKELAAATLEELRKLALDLRPTMLDDLGLVPAVQWLSRGAAERANFEVKLSLSGFEEQERLAPELETCLFRITQESLTNITKHAQAHTVEIKLERVAPEDSQGSEKVRLTVCDDGRGFDRGQARAKAYQGGHLGLFDIEERSTLLNGKVEIGPANPGAERPGTRISVLLPLHARHAEPPHGISTSVPPYVK